MSRVSDCPFVKDLSDNVPLLSSTASSSNIAVIAHSEDSRVNQESQYNDAIGNNINLIRLMLKQKCKTFMK